MHSSISYVSVSQREFAVCRIATFFFPESKDCASRTLDEIDGLCYWQLGPRCPRTLRLGLTCTNLSLILDSITHSHATSTRTSSQQDYYENPLMCIHKQVVHVIDKAMVSTTVFSSEEEEKVVGVREDAEQKRQESEEHQDTHQATIGW